VLVPIKPFDFQEVLFFNQKPCRTLLINTVHVYSKPLINVNRGLWEDLLNDLNAISTTVGTDLKVIVNCEIAEIDKNDGAHDGTIAQGALTNLYNEVRHILQRPHSDHIAGWYIADEPRVSLPPDRYSYTSQQVQLIYNLNPASNFLKFAEKP
jgi:hypothetical protein